MNKTFICALIFTALLAILTLTGCPDDPADPVNDDDSSTSSTASSSSSSALPAPAADPARHIFMFDSGITGINFYTGYQNDAGSISGSSSTVAVSGLGLQFDYVYTTAWRGNEIKVPFPMTIGTNAACSEGISLKLRLEHQENYKFYLRSGGDGIVFEYPASGDGFYGYGGGNTDFHEITIPWQSWGIAGFGNSLNPYGSNALAAVINGESLSLTILIMQNDGQTGADKAELYTTHTGYLDEVQLYGTNCIAVPPAAVVDNTEFQDIANSNVFVVNDANYTIHLNLQYLNPADDYQKQMCKGDLFSPTTGSNWPVILLMHGGSLKFGSKDESLYTRIAWAMVEEGCQVFNINYRFIPDVNHPGPIQDTAAAFHWLKNRAGNYGGDTNRIFLGGFSAGAYLSAIVCSDPQYLSAHGYSFSDVTGAMPLSAQLYEHSTVFENINGYLQEGNITTNAPIYHASASLPPYLVMTWAGDSPVYPNGANDFYTAMTNTGHPDISLNIITDNLGSHAGIILGFDDPADQVRTNWVNFINSH